MCWIPSVQGAVYADWIVAASNRANGVGYTLAYTARRIISWNTSVACTRRLALVSYWRLCPVDSRSLNPSHPELLRCFLRRIRAGLC